MTPKQFQLPEEVRNKIQQDPVHGTPWLNQLDAWIHALESEWNITAKESLTGGSESLVLRVDLADTTPAILKLLMPGGAGFAGETAALRIAGGRGYARLLNADPERAAMLLESLGPTLATENRSPADEIQALVETLQQAWVPVDNPESLMTGAEKAHWLATFIEDTWNATNKPCDECLVRHAQRFAEERANAHDPARSVLVHGDPHTQNLLRDPASPGTFRFIDPDGLHAEPEYDLGVLMREWNGELLSGDPRKLGEARCQHLAHTTGTNESAIWQWGFTERLSTALYLVQLGYTEEGTQMLAVAESWT